MRVTVIGCGDAFGSGGRRHAATLVEGAGGSVLVDCGPTTMTGLNALGLDPLAIDAVAITHLHGDHFAGLPSLLLDAQWVRARTRPLAILGPPGTERRLEEALELFFPDTMAETTWRFAWTATDLQPGSRLEVAGFSLATAGVEHDCGSPATAVRLAAEGSMFVHSGDTGWTDALPEIAGEADLLFLECTGLDQPVPGHIDYATLSAKTLATKAPLFRARQVVLTHLGPDVLASLHRIDRTRFDVAWDGRVFEL